MDWQRRKWGCYKNRNMTMPKCEAEEGSICKELSVSSRLSSCKHQLHTKYSTLIGKATLQLVVDKRAICRNPITWCNPYLIHNDYCIVEVKTTTAHLISTPRMWHEPFRKANEASVWIPWINKWPAISVMVELKNHWGAVSQLRRNCCIN